MSGVQSGTKKYNALVTVDAKSDAESDNKVKKYNMDEVADMSAMDANFDCMSADKYSATNIIYAFNNMPGVGVTVSYSYSINKNGVRKTFPDPNSALKDDYTMVIYDNSSDTVNHNLRNVYLFYNPWYTSTGTLYNTCNDVIIINNKDKLDCTVNIVKQKTISDQS